MAKITNVRVVYQHGELGVRTEHLHDCEYKLCDTYVVLWKQGGKPMGEEIGKFEGFTTDFASIPGIGRVFMPTNGRNAEAAIAHDYFYQFAHMFDPKMTRKTADRIFYLLLKLARVGRVQAWLQYKAVRLAGWYLWRKHPNR